jgi:hypothetical protein
VLAVEVICDEAAIASSETLQAEREQNKRAESTTRAGRVIAVSSGERSIDCPVLLLNLQVAVDEVVVTARSSEMRGSLADSHAARPPVISMRLSMPCRWRMLAAAEER